MNNPYPTASKANIIDEVLSWLGGHWPLIILGAIIVVMLFNTFRVVRTKQAGIVERLGKYNRTWSAGLHVLIPFVERLVDIVDLQILKIETVVEVKTKTNEFFRLPIAVFYVAIESKAAEAYYELDDPEGTISSLVQNEVKSTATAMSLQDVFNARGEIKAAVEETLTEELAGYGYRVVQVVIDNPDLPEALKDAFNNVTIAQQQQTAATAQAAATRIRMTGEAEAEAASLKIKGQAYAEFRETIAAGNAAAVLKMTQGTDLPHVTALATLAILDGNDAVRDAAGKGATVVVATGASANDGLLGLMAKQ